MKILSHATAFLLVLILFNCNISVSEAQCLANAGNDTILCHSNGFQPIVLGGNPTAIGGTPPYTYCWERNHYVGSSNFYASMYLDDTTLANPTLLFPSVSPLEFHLRITDANEIICRDTVTVRFSTFFALLVDNYYYLLPGDSMQFNMGTIIYGNLPPTTYLWQPSTGLSDPTSLSSWAKPDVTTFYSLTATDSIGCSFTCGPVYYVFISGTDVEELNNGERFSLSPNPVQNSSSATILNNSGAEISIDFYDLEGRLKKCITTSMMKMSFEMSDFTPGAYFYRVTCKKELISTGKLIVQ